MPRPMTPPRLSETATDANDATDAICRDPQPWERRRRAGITMLQSTHASSVSVAFDLSRAFPGGIESGGFPTAFAQAKLEKLIRLGARSMPKPYSTDLRERAVEAVESGASRREVAEVFEVGVSSVIRWCRRRSETGSVEAKPSGGSTSPLEEHSEWLLTLVARQPDLTLKEILAAMAKQGIGGSQSALQRFFDRHNVSFKKKSARGGAKASRCRSRPPTLDTRARLA